MKKTPIVSAIVSTYNSEKFIRGCIENIIAQTIFNEMEIVIINSGSKQNEDEIINEYVGEYSNIKYLKTEERETIYKSWNRGIELAAGKYISNANTDDRLRKDAYESLVKHLETHPEIALVYADQYISDVPNQNFESIKKNKIEVMPDYNFLLQLDRCIVFSQPMWRSSLHFVDDLWFDENLKICGDHDFEIRVSMKYKMLHVPEPLGVFYLDKNKSNVSHQNVLEVDRERQAMTKKHIDKYIENLSREEINRLIGKFKLYADMPFFALQIKYHLKDKVLKQKQNYSYEFSYYFLSRLLISAGRKDEAIHYCKKYLDKRNSPRIEDLLNWVSKK